jgi:prophage regulatory protein
MSANAAKPRALKAISPSPTTAKPRFLRLPSVLERVPFSRPSIYRKMREGTFPLAINLGGKAVAWLESDIDNFMNERIQASRDVSPRPETNEAA